MFELDSSIKKGKILAREYRPKKLSEVLGQDVVVQSIKNGIIEKRLPQAIILNGIRGTGKTSLARIIARSINCNVGGEFMNVDPCGKCQSCKSIDEGRNIDILEMDAASHTGVDDVKEIIESTKYKAVIGKFKVFIIDEVHMLSKSAFNALLKTLEEPPENSMFIFATTEIQKIPDTIISRCQRFDLKRISPKILSELFKKICQNEGFSFENDAILLITMSADGSARDGITILNQAMTLSSIKKVITEEIVNSMLALVDKRIIYELLSSIIDKNVSELIFKFRELVNYGADPLMIIQNLLDAIYRVATLKVTPKLIDEELITQKEMESLKPLIEKISSEKILSLWKIVLSGYSDAKISPNVSQSTEVILMRFCYTADIPSISEILEKLENDDEKKNS